MGWPLKVKKKGAEKMLLISIVVSFENESPLSCTKKGDRVSRGLFVFLVIILKNGFVLSMLS